MMKIRLKYLKKLILTTQSTQVLKIYIIKTKQFGQQFLEYSQVIFSIYIFIKYVDIKNVITQSTACGYISTLDSFYEKLSTITVLD